MFEHHLSNAKMNTEMHSEQVSPAMSSSIPQCTVYDMNILPQSIYYMVPRNYTMHPFVGGCDHEDGRNVERGICEQGGCCPRASAQHCRNPAQCRCPGHIVPCRFEPCYCVCIQILWWGILKACCLAATKEASDFCETLTSMNGDLRAKDISLGQEHREQLQSTEVHAEQGQAPLSMQTRLST